MRRAIERDGHAQRLLLEGRTEEARAALHEVAELYRRSWEAAPPGSYGRLIGMLKAAILAGEAEEAATFARGEVPEPDSPAAAYASALAAIVEGDDAAAAASAEAMRAGGDAFERTAEALAALAGGDRERYAAAVGAIVADFESRDRHLTGVPIADTALVLQALAAERGLAAELSSPVLPEL